ncbi:MDR family MFS transporter [Phycicoccus sp. 3266]|uniref:MDR family MFS transporter n=1 Tax=Phycicoccus sp. 3266 TaxID=2817751 RepID=UPI0028611CB1|nr:MDR family MFS transporter [Phycicoccus sp. 3266]MDR6863445.1 EmrB/QacA subfamily drug resistance transporter [Phycicoccus sp. 3266]
MSATTAPATGIPEQTGEMSHRQILEAMTGLLAGLFTALISSTIVSTALPTIIGDLHGTQRQYTWVITASLLATTVSTPIWGKLSDLFSKKLLVQLSLAVFVLGSVAAGQSHSVGFLIACRVVQGLGMGGLTALTQSILGAMIAPRERGRYSGYMGAVMAVSTVSGPLLGGFIVDSGLGWRWTFYVCVPLAIIAMFILQATLHITTPKRMPKIDYLGAVLIAITSSLPLLWVTFAGNDFPWWSTQTALYLGGTLVGLLLTIVVELRAAEPIIPIRLLRNLTTGLVIIASVAVGVAMFGGTTFLTQYFQVSRGYSPTHAGLLTIPLMGALLLSSTLGGRYVSNTGKWKGIIIIGGVLLTVGLVWLGRLDHLTPLWQIGTAMALLGLGMGMMMQNLVLAVQNSVDVRDIGAASASIAFFRTLGGAMGVSVLGAVLANGVRDHIAAGLEALGPKAAAAAQSGGGTGTLDVKDMPAPIREIVRAAYGDSTGHIFLIAAAFGVVALLAVLFVKETPLRTTVSMTEQAPVTMAEEAPVAAAAATAATTGTGAPEATGLVTSTGAQEDNLEPAPESLPVPAALRPAGAESDSGPVPAPERVLEPQSQADAEELAAVAALDVLSAAEQEVRRRARAGDEAVAAARTLVTSLGREVEEALEGFQRGLASVLRDLDDPAAGRHSTHRVAEQLHDLEFTLLRSSQATADRVVAAAHAEAETIVARARLEASRVGRPDVPATDHPEERASTADGTASGDAGQSGEQPAERVSLPNRPTQD